MNTTKLSNGKTVLAKDNGSALTYTNRKQAEAKASTVSGSSVFQSYLSRVFFVAVS